MIVDKNEKHQCYHERLKGRQGKILIAHIKKGWKKFMNENKFKFGDELLFILVFTNSTDI
jgi:hypothetical protein